MIVIHHLQMSQSERIVWLCEELDLPYELRLYQRHPTSGMAPPEYKQLHPAGSSPVVQDGDLIMAESGAIIEYIARQCAPNSLVREPDEPSFYDYLYWYHFANSSLGCNALVEVLLKFIGHEPDTISIKNVLARVDLAHRIADERLTQVPWFAGDAFSAADIMMVFHFTTMRRFTPRDLSPYPALLAYLQRIGDRPAYQRAMAVCEPELGPLLV